MKKNLILALIISLLLCLGLVSAEVLINEVLPNVGSIDWDNNGVVSESDDEWVELYNNDTVALNISGWKISDKDQVRYTFPTPTMLEANGYIIVFDLSLVNGNENVTLYDNSSNMIDSYAWSSDPGNDVSIGRKHDGLSEWVNFTVPTPLAANNRLPIGKIDNQTIDEDKTAYFIVTEYISDPDNFSCIPPPAFNGWEVDFLTFEVIDDNEVDCNITDNINVTLTPAAGWNGVANCTIEVDDGYGTVNKTFYIIVSAVNDAPVITTIPINTTLEDHNYTYDVNATDADNDNISYYLIVYPSGMTINKTDGVISWLPTNDDVGLHNITIKVNDIHGAYSNQSYVLDVTNVNDAPYFNPSLKNKTVNEDSNLTYDINASDIDGDNLSFTSNITVVGGAINDTTGLLMWIPDNAEVGEHNIKVEVCDDSGEANNCTDGSFVITVVNTNDAPTLGAISDQPINEDSLLQFYLNGTDIDPNDILNYSCNLSALNVHKINNTLANVTWIPTNNYVGNHSVNCTVRDLAGEKDSKAFIIEVKNTNDAPLLASIGDKTAIESLPLTFTLSATDEDPTNDTLTFGTNASIGNFNLNPATGKVTFTPVYADVGVYDILFNVSDGKGGKDNETITLTVNSALEIIDLDIIVNGSRNDNLEDEAIVNARPGSTVQADIKLKNMINIDIRGVAVNGTLNTNLGLFKQSSLIPNMNPGDTNLVTLEFNLPNIIGEKLYPLEIKGIGEDENHIMREVERTIYINVTQEGNDVILEDINLTPSKIACVKNATLRFNITNKGKYDQINGNTIKITNEQLGIDIEDNFTIAENSTIAETYSFDAITTQTGIFHIKINVTWFYVNEIAGYVDLEIVKCIDVPNNSIDEDTIPPSNWIDLWNYTKDPNYLPSYFTYAISQSNESLINCSLISNQYVNCSTPAANQNGYSDINVNVVGGSYADYDTFRLTVKLVNDAPVAYNVSAKLDEDSSVLINFNCSDIDDSSLSYMPNNPTHGALSGSEGSRTYKPNANYNGADSFTYKCNDGEDDSNIASVGITVNSVLDKPSITSPSPEDDILIGDNENQAFSVTVNNPDNISIKISWYVNGNFRGNGDTYAFNGTVSGIYEVIANLTNSTETESYDKEKWSKVRVSTVPVTTYNGTIKLVNDSNVNAFTELTIYNNNAKIDFGNQTINLSKVVNVDRYVNISAGVVGIDSTAYGFDVFKIPAKITMYGLVYDSTPKIYYNSGFTVSGTQECTAITDPACTNIVYNTSTKILTFDASHFTIFFLPLINRAPTITSSPLKTAIIDEEYRYDVEATDPDGDILQYSLTTKPSGMTINSATGLISWTPKNITTENVTVSVTDNINTVTQSFEIGAKEGAKLGISDLDIKVGDKTHKDVSNGDTISRKAKPGDKVKVDVEVKNMFSSSSDIQIEGIEVTVTIDGIDDGDDLEESADIEDLDAGDDDSATLEFTIPTLVDEGVYDVIIEIDAEDENGKEQDIRWELKLEVNKDKHALLIEKAELYPLTIECNRNPSLDIKVVNIGSEDEDEVTIKITNDKLGLNIEENNIELEEGSDEDSVFEKTYNLNIDDKVEEGTYPITIKAYYDSKTGDEKTVDLTVKKCVEVVTPLETEPVEVIKTTKPITTEVKPPVTEISFRDTTEYLALLAILVVILLGGVIFLVGAAVILLRKK